MQLVMIKQSIMFPQFPSHACRYARGIITEHYRVAPQRNPGCFRFDLFSIRAWEPIASLLVRRQPSAGLCSIWSHPSGFFIWNIFHVSFLSVSWRYFQLGW